MNAAVSAKHLELVTKLREVFQIDRPELDFGIYRILNARAKEINDYLDKRLLEKVRDALGQGAQAQREQVAQELNEKEAQYRADGMDPGTVPKVKELRDKLAQYNAGSTEHENAVFSHLLTFFSRYYDNGDFISQRRYKGDTYAIPYSGEEVMLHWANKDQYYTKSGENFTNYSFKLPGQDGQPARTVHLRLVAADTAKDNRKDNDKDRRFVLVEPCTVTRLDEQGEEFEETLLPVEEIDGAASHGAGNELLIRFEYKAVPKGSRQDALVDKAVVAILSDATVKARWLDLGGRAPTENKPQRTLLEKHLSDYVEKNLSDYFIHKDLGGFLRRELDFYIKNEVMHLDDLQNASAFVDIEKSLRMIQCLRTIAQELITFLAQLEDFQKKLWLKKKFVVSSHYCITVDRVPENLYAEIAANVDQWKQWKQLGVWDSDTPGTVKDLKTAPYRMVDTSLYENDFNRRLLSDMGDIDESIRGLIVNADNFQALSLLSERLKRSIDFIYIDPPYNATTSQIAYKNGFKHGSWITLMENRLSRAKALMGSSTPLCVAIDENEREHLAMLVKNLFADGEMTQISVVHNPRGIQGNGFSVTNESAIFFKPNGKNLGKRSLDNSKSKPLMKTGSESERHTAKNCFYPLFVKNGLVVGFGDVPEDNFHPSSACVRGENGVLAVWPISSSDNLERKWRYARQSVEAIKANLEVKIGRNGLPSINLAKDKESYRTVWSDAEFNAAEYGSTLLKNIVPGNGFSFPKSLFTVRHSISAADCKSDGVVLDFFAGSGTTAHAVISLNRDEELDRSYVMIEQGDYFDTVLKPRIQKVIFSADWSEGTPTSLDTGNARVGAERA